MISSLACICGGVGEVLIIGGIVSGVAWLWRKLRGKKTKSCGDACCHEGGTNEGHKDP